MGAEEPNPSSAAVTALVNEPGIRLTRSVQGSYGWSILLPLSPVMAQDTFTIKRIQYIDAELRQLFSDQSIDDIERIAEARRNGSRR